jgi:protein TonB
MIRHLTEDQITRWFAGRPTTAERQHVHDCRTCANEVEHFGSTLSLFQSAVADRAQRTFAAPPSMMTIVQTHTSAGQVVFGNFVEPPSLLVSLKRAIADALYPPKVETSAAPVDVPSMWSKSRSQVPQGLSVLLHAAVVASLVFFPAAASNLILPTATSITMLAPTAPLLLPPDAGKSGGGGGGGGMRAPTPASKGVPPRGADKQLLPPVVEVKNLAPNLVVEPTIIAPQLAYLPQFNFNTIGDPNGIVGPPSQGTGTGGGIGNNKGTGVGDGNGPGAGLGEGGGAGGGPFDYTIGGGLTPPAVLLQVLPEYSDDARKAKTQGTVELIIIVNADGTSTLERVSRSIGYGLEQKAIEAVKKWKFQPATKDGKPVAMRVSISVNFSLR